MPPLLYYTITNMVDDDSPILKRRPLRRPPVIPASPESPSQAVPKLAVPSTPGSSALLSAPACDAPPPTDTLSTSALISSGSPALQSAVGCRWLEARRLKHLQKMQITNTPPVQPPLDGPLPPSSFALPTAVAAEAVMKEGQSSLDGPSSPSSSALPTAVASEAVVRAERRAARVSSRLSRRQRKLNDKRIAHQAVEVNAANESMEGSSNSEDDAYVDSGRGDGFGFMFVLS